MGLLHPGDVDAIRQASRIGFWRVEFGDGTHPRFYADAVMDELLGITGNPTPEERYDFFNGNIHPDDLPLFADYTLKLTETRAEVVYRYINPVCGEMTVRCGGSRDMSVTNCFCIRGTHQDITDVVRLEQNKAAERRLAEQNLALKREQSKQENYYRDLLDLQNCGLLAYTMPGHRIIHMNAEALRMYHVKDIADMQANLGPVLSRVYYPDAAAMEKLRSLRHNNDAVDYECILNKGCEGECHIMAKTKAIEMPNGERAVITTFIDVSDMVTLREALQRAEAGSKAKSAFLFAMSHDLRTPMNAIIGYTNLLESHWGEPVCREYLAKLKEAGSFLLSLIGNVLEISRVESGKETLHESAWDLRKLRGTLDVLLEGEIERKQLTVTSRVDLPHPLVFCDIMKLREIAMNLLSNAVKYTPAGGRIALTLDELPADKPDCGLYRLSVRDSGMGISPEYIPHLFEAFTRERDSSESGILGTGLGLRIVKSFVDLMGGTVDVQSEPGKGSQFTVTLCLRRAAPEDLQPDTAPTAPAAALKGCRILLAEDNTLNAEIAATILQDAGLSVDVAENGAVALEKLQAAPVGHYDAILMDIQMPRMNGYDAARAIRALPDPRAKTPIIAMTANAFEEDRQAAFAAGMDGYAAKPIEPAKLFGAIGDILGENKS